MGRGSHRGIRVESLIEYPMSQWDALRYFFSQRRKEGSVWRLAMLEKARRGRRALPRAESPIECPISELETWRAGVLARRGGWGQPPSIRHLRNIPKGRATASRLTARAESPTVISVGQRPTFGCKKVFKPCKGASKQAFALSGLL